MNKISKWAVVTAISGFSVFAMAQAPAKDHPCEAIKTACESAGFVKREAKDGTGLWVDCIDPIMQSKPQPAKAKKPLPTVDASVVAACKAKHANFGEGKKH